MQSSSATIAVLQQVAAAPGRTAGACWALREPSGAVGGQHRHHRHGGAGIGGAEPGRQTSAAAHALFNLSGAAVCWLLLPQFTALVRLVSPHGPESAVLARQIANAHTLFNLGCTVLWLPLTPCMVRIVCILLPEKHAPELK